MRHATLTIAVLAATATVTGCQDADATPPTNTIYAAHIDTRSWAGEDTK